MTKQEEAQKEWHQYSIDNWVGDDTHEAYQKALDDFKSALKAEIENELSGYIKKRDGWKEGSEAYEAYDLVVRVCKKNLELIDETKPLK